jgi:hypothetical protein
MQEIADSPHFCLTKTGIERERKNRNGSDIQATANRLSDNKKDR